ncbi:MAG: GNAT family N-acetyltransferase [Longimicrobiales bacterium]|nr:GNAT family N-acetyltransferase [Longimicrobiales bacterium]
MRIRPLVRADWPAVRRIYREGMEGGDATFETELPTWEAWDAARLEPGRLVAEEEAGVVGFAAASRYSRRAVYSGVAEVMVYVAADARGRGLGTALLEALVQVTEEAGIWTLLAGVFPENRASIRAHRSVGFRVVGRHERIGRFHDGRWRDTILLERRSPKVGVD